jgi:hypothetical protein
LTWVSGKVAAVGFAGVTMAATLTVLVAAAEPRASSPASSPAPAPVAAAFVAPRHTLGEPIPASDSVADVPLLEPVPVVVSAPLRPRAESPAPAEQLRLARAALVVGDPARTLELLDALDEHDTRLLGQRTATRVGALCKLGEVERAQIVVAQLREREPNAPVLAQLDGACW